MTLRSRLDRLEAVQGHASPPEACVLWRNVDDPESWPDVDRQVAAQQAAGRSVIIIGVHGDHETHIAEAKRRLEEDLAEQARARTAP